MGAYGARLSIFEENLEKVNISLFGEWRDLNDGKDVYSFTIPIKKLLPNLYYFTIEIICIFGIIYLNRDGSLSLFPNAAGRFLFLILSFKSRLGITAE